MAEDRTVSKRAAERLSRLRQSQKKLEEFKPIQATIYGPRGYVTKPPKPKKQA